MSFEAPALHILCLCESSVESSSIDLVGMALRTFIDLGVSDSIHPDLLYTPPHTHNYRIRK